MTWRMRGWILLGSFSGPLICVGMHGGRVPEPMTLADYFVLTLTGAAGFLLALEEIE